MIVVLSGVPKTEMEETFKDIIGMADRYGSSFVFRCDLRYPPACCLHGIWARDSPFWPLTDPCGFGAPVLVAACNRQGNPLLPEDLRMVAASKAAATVIVSDTSRWALLCLFLQQRH